MTTIIKQLIKTLPFSNVTLVGLYKISSVRFWNKQFCKR